MKLSQITFRYLKGQKKHTFFSITAVTIAVAFMTTILAAVSVYNAAALNVCKETNGTYHVVFSGLDKEQLVDIRSMDIFERTQLYGISSYTSSTEIDFGQFKSENAEIEYMLVNDMPVNDSILRLKANDNDLLPPDLRSVSEGRLPEKDGEIVLSRSSAEMWGYPEIGSTVSAELIVCRPKTNNALIPSGVPVVLAEKFDIAEVKTIEFTLVGYSDKANIVDYNDTRLKSYTYLSDNLVCTFADHTNDLYWDMHHAFADKGYEIDDFSYGLNQELLDMEGKGVDAKFSRAMFFALVYLVVIFLMFCVRMVIDNAFEISAKERIRQFGLLKAAGASKKQVFSMVMWESLFLAVPGVIAGLLLGTGFAAIIYNAVISLPYLHDAADGYNIAEMMIFDVQPYVYISSAFIGIMWVVISAISTGMRSIKASPVEAMRAAGKKETLRVPKKPAKKSSSGSFISSYASLSVTRNKKRYAITIVSMIMSIVLFTVFSYASELINDDITKEFEYSRQPYDYTVRFNALSPEAVLEQVKEMNRTHYFTDIQYDSRLVLFTNRTAIGIDAADDKFLSEDALVNIHPVNADTYKKYISAESGMSYDEFSESGKIMLCKDMYGENGQYDYTVFSSSAVIPESISGEVVLTETAQFLDAVTVETAGIYTTDNVMYRSIGFSVSAIVAEENYIALLGEQQADDYTFFEQSADGSVYPVYYRTIAANAAPNKKTEALNYLKSHFYGEFDDNRSDMNKSYAKLEIIKLLGYFAVGIIALIAIVNIVNIISSNVLGRTAELAMLRACGMSGKQLHNLIFRESLMYAAVASFISLVLTELAVYVIQIPFKTHFHDLTMEDLGFEFSYTDPLKYILIAAAAAFITAAAASWLPANRIINSSIVDNIDSADRI